nr:MFS transporter [Serinicoccus kebangsaanensis]
MLFRDSGLSSTQISVLLVVWSVSAFLLEVPSGAWADLVDRRRLLVASGVVYVAAFLTWLTWPSFWGFLLGFVLWSVSDAMHSGTWEAYLFDQLADHGASASYGRIRARAESVALVVMAAAIAVAAPLHQLGGYPLVGWASAAVAVVHVGVTLSLPRAGQGRHRAEPDDPVPDRTTPRAVAPTPETSGGPDTWRGTLAAGLRHARGSQPVRRILLGYAAIVALVGFDEFLPLVLAADGITVGGVALVMAAIVLLEAVATWLADRVALLRGARHAALVGVAGLLLAGGAWWSGWVAAAALACGYALASSAYVAGDVRLQHALEESAPRATVTSVASVVAELGFLVTLACVGLATLVLDLTTVVAATALVLTLPAVLAAWRMPAGRA